MYTRGKRMYNNRMNNATGNALESLYVETFSASYGPVTVAASERGIVTLDFDAGGRQRAREAAGLCLRAEGACPFPVEELLLAYLKGRLRAFTIPVVSALPGPSPRNPLEACLWQTLRTVPFGAAVTLTELARRAGCARRVHYVAGLLARNPVPILLPCHRVWEENEAFQPYVYPGGPGWKSALLRLEGIRVAAAPPHGDDDDDD